MVCHRIQGRWIPMDMSNNGNHPGPHCHPTATLRHHPLQHMFTYCSKIACTHLFIPLHLECYYELGRSSSEPMKKKDYIFTVIELITNSWPMTFFQVFRKVNSSEREITSDCFADTEGYFVKRKWKVPNFYLLSIGVAEPNCHLCLSKSLKFYPLSMGHQARLLSLCCWLAIPHTCGPQSTRLPRWARDRSYA